MLLASVATVLVASIVAFPLSRATGRDAGWLLALPLLAAAGMVVAASTSTAGAAEQRLDWMPSIGVDLALRLDGLALLFALLVLVIGAGVLAYSARYLQPGRHGAFYGLMSGFAAAMLLLVLADDLVVLFVAWEATTLCSFFLIARSGLPAREPAIRTLLVTAAGGLSLLAAVVVVAVNTGTTQLSAALADPAWTQDAGFATTVAVLVVVAALTKSAQFPFQAWLPDSMIAITPVSAYLHAAAMVKAGIYLLLRFSPALSGVGAWELLLIGCGAITAVLGAVAALRRYDQKELLAYSTISQLGLIVVLIGVGTPAALTAAIAHTVAHALFKAALFMLVGVIEREAGTRDIRHLAEVRVQMPFTVTAVVLAAASMAGVPLLLGFVSKEAIFAALLEAPGPAWWSIVLTGVVAATAALTFAYSGRIVLGALGGPGRERVTEASVSFWVVPAACALAGLVLGVAPFLLDALVSDASSAAVGSDVDAHLALWHGFNAPLVVSLLVLGTGTAAVLARRPVDHWLAPRRFPFSGLDVVDALRAATIRAGATVGGWTGSTAPRRHLAIPVVGLCVIALAGVLTVRGLPAVVGDPTRPLDWVLVALIAGSVVAAVRAQSRIAAIVVVGVVGFTMTLWFFALGAADVALTQLLVEILTVCVMVLLLRRLPARFRRSARRDRLPAGILAVAAGGATTLGVWALTGRREMSDAADYYLRDGERVTGGANIVNTILVDFRALDTLGELTVLGVAGVAIAALLQARHLSPAQPVAMRTRSPIADAGDNAVFARSASRLLGPVVVLLSLFLLLRGHQEPGGGFIAALIGGAGFALVYLSAPSDQAARVRWPYLALIGAGVAVGAGTGFLGYVDGSFLTPLHAELLGFKLTTALIFDVGVYLAVIGIVLAAFNLLGRGRGRDEHDGPVGDDRVLPDLDERSAR